MDKDLLEDIFISVRPYICNAEMIKSFIEDNSDSGHDSFINELRDTIDKSKGTDRTDFQILLNAVEKHHL
ncbi:MAG: hypothetical protein JW825_06745 [Candidatus Methanofastidiosa archaeon]|nr:hypothetical protein [Candidatus Methanofastidiosa archaeon]